MKVGCSYGTYREEHRKRYFEKDSDYLQGSFTVWFSDSQRRISSMMLKGQNARLMTRRGAWRSRAFFGLACPSATSLGINTLTYVNTIGTPKSVEHRFSDCSQRQR